MGNWENNMHIHNNKEYKQWVSATFLDESLHEALVNNSQIQNWLRSNLIKQTAQFPLIKKTDNINAKK